jgi:biopolymer transport protein ExbB
MPLLVVTFLICMGMMVSLAFAEEAAAGAHGPETKTVMDKFHEGGWIMYPLAMLSMWCAGLVIEGFVRIRLPVFSPGDIVVQLRDAFAQENYQQAWRICKSRSSFLTNTLRRGLERIGKGRPATEAAIADSALKESMMYRTRISYLSTIGVCAPMVGLLGTVTGMIKAFESLGHGGIADPSKLAAAIGEVLIATATGLGVAIPGFFMYYFFRNHLQKVVTLTEDVINQLMVDVKYEELSGLRIGEEMEAQLAGQAGGAAPLPGQPPMPQFHPAGGQQAPRMSQMVSGSTAACPQCNTPLVAGTPRCATCGIELQWT